LEVDKEEEKLKKKAMRKFTDRSFQLELNQKPRQSGVLLLA
jgi:hypothetical protein